MTDTMTIGSRLVELCQQQQFTQAINELYADDIVSVEAVDMCGMGRETSGIDNIRAASEQWCKNTKVHSIDVQGPFPHDNRFAVIMKLDHTMHDGPMAGQRMEVQEVCLYTVADGKITRAEYFYPTENC